MLFPQPQTLLMLHLCMLMASHVAQCLSLGVIPRQMSLPPISVSVLSLEVVMAHFCCLTGCLLQSPGIRGSNVFVFFYFAI